MRMSQAAMAYRNAALALPPRAAVVMLYDGAILRIERAVQALQAGRLDESFNHVTHAAAILRGLSHVLDFARGGALAEQLLAMYSQNILALLRSVGKPDAAVRYRRIAEGLGELRDAWAEVARLPARKG
jgi:flagellar secretion chaperone FliS